jgi:CRP-like cAMP-binding protein
MERMKQYFKNIYKLSDSECDIIKIHTQAEHLRAGEYFLRKGQACHHLGFIEKGIMHYTFFKETGEEVTCNFASEDEFIGESEAFFLQKLCVYNLKAALNCTVITINLENFKSIQKNFPAFREISDDINYKTVRGLLDKRSFLAGNDAVSKYRNFVNQFPEVLLRVPLGYIASYLDITQQSLSRIREQLI